MSKCSICGVAGDSATLWEDAIGKQVCDECLDAIAEEQERCAIEGCRELSLLGQALCRYHSERVMPVR